VRDQDYSLESLIAPFLADFKVEGHKLSSFTPALPMEFNPDSSSAFSSEAVCEVCGAFFMVARKPAAPCALTCKRSVAVRPAP